MAEIFVCLYRVSLIAKSICEECKSNLRAAGAVARPRGNPFSPMLEQDMAGFKRTLVGATHALADCHLTISPAGIEALNQDSDLSFSLGAR
jgi:hypothetical protein